MVAQSNVIVGSFSLKPKRCYRQATVEKYETLLLVSKDEALSPSSKDEALLPVNKNEVLSPIDARETLTSMLALEILFSRVLARAKEQVLLRVLKSTWSMQLHMHPRQACGVRCSMHPKTHA